MNKFIWVKDIDGRQHYVNIDHIVRVTSVPAASQGSLKHSGYAYIKTVNGEDFDLVKEDGYDTFDDIVSKIQAVS